MTEESSNYDEWLEKINKAAGITEQAIIKEVKEEEKAVVKAFKKPFPWKSFLLLAGLFLLGLVPRLVLLFGFTIPENPGVGYYSDAFHHWQIAYFAKEVGFSHGFLRLWDFKGLEYFWGLAHPLVLIFLMTITGSHSIVLDRLMTTVAGSLNVMLLFLVVRRYTNWKVALTAALFAAFNPTGWFNDITGMVEPLGIVFLLSALYFWPKRAFVAVLFLVFASMTRAEYWLFAVGLIGVFILFSKETMNKKIMLAFGYSLGILLYMKYLLDYTGNPIYPIWWNFLGNAAGKWQANVPLTPEQAAVQPIWVAMFIIAVLVVPFILWKKPRGWELHTLGLMNFGFLGFVVGMTAYMKSYVGYFWYTRLFTLPYMYLGFVIGLLLFFLIPKIIPLFGKLHLGWLFVIAGLLLVQLSWKPLWWYYTPTVSAYYGEVQRAKEVVSAYTGGTILVHEGDPVLVYELVKDGISAQNIEGEMYDPFQYKPFIDHPSLFDDWQHDRHYITDWLRRDNIRLIMFYQGRERYVELVKREPKIFHFIKQIGDQKLYEVTL